MSSVPVRDVDGNMHLQLLQEVSDKVGSAVLITGGPRTGTSLMSNLVSSLDHVECFYEPPFLSGFLLLMKSLDQEKAKFILESFLFHELFYQALAGRRLNFNEHDESCVYRSRPRDEVMERLARSHSFRELFPRTLEHRLAFKVPGVMQELELLRSYYRDMTFLVMLRRPDSVIASLVGRRWLSDRQFEESVGEFVFHRTPHAAGKIPAWVPSDLIEEFVRLPEVDRCALYYIEQYRHLSERRDCVVVDYDRLVRDPRDYFPRVVETLEESFGSMTSALLDTIHERPRDHSDVLEQVQPTRRRRLIELYQDCRQLSLSSPARD